MNPAHVAYLLAIASHLSGYPVPHDAQTAVIELSYVEMAEAACDDHLLGCNILGFYKDGDPAVYVLAGGDDANGTDEDSIVVHELTHWLQYRNGKRGYACPGMLVREYEAYQTQLKFIVRVEHKADPHLVVPQSTCYPVEQ